MSPTTVAPKFLVVEDNDADAALILHMFSELKLINDISVANNGDQALAYFHEQNTPAASDATYILITDIGLPKDDGFTVIENILRANPLRKIYSVILTGGPIEECIAISHDRGIKLEGYLTKPLMHGDLIDIVKNIKNMGIGLVTSTSKTNGAAA